MSKALRRTLSVLLAVVLLSSASPLVLGSVSAEGNDANEAYINFNDNMTSYNMSGNMGDNSPAVLVEKDGRYGWQLSSTSEEKSSSIYCNVEDTFAGDTSEGNVFEVEVDYYDDSRALFSLVYHSTTREDYLADTIVMESVGVHGVNKEVYEWKTAKFLIQDADFKNVSTVPDIRICAHTFNRNTIDTTTKTEWDTNYGTYYLNTYGAVSTEDPITIGAIRIKKTGLKNPLKVKAHTISSASYTFFDEESAVIGYDVENIKANAQNLDVKYEIFDIDDRLVAEKSDTLSLAPNEKKSYSVDFGPLEKYGRLRAVATYTANGVQNVTELPFAHAREATELNPRLGTNVHFEGSASYPQNAALEFPLIKKAGYSSIRDTLRWYRIQPGLGPCELTPQIKQSKDYCKDFGIDYFGIIAIDNQETGDQSSPGTLEKFSDYAAWISNEFSEVSSYLESDNEWNLRMDPGIGTEDYIYLIKSTYEGVKRGNPDMPLVGGCWGGFRAKDFETIFDTGCGEYMDAFSYHVYWGVRTPPDAGTFTQGLSVRNIMDSRGYEDMPLWLTENGFPDYLLAPITLEDQALSYAQLIVMNSAWKTFDRIYPYEFLDDGTQVQFAESRFGTVTSGFDTHSYMPKLSYVTTACANWALSHTEFVDALDGMEAKSKNFVYRYKRDNSDGRGEDLIVLFSTDDRVDYGLDLGANTALCYDMYGNEKTIGAVDGVFNMVLTYRPVYLIGNFRNFKHVDSTVKVDTLSANAAPLDTVIQTITLPDATGAEIIPTDSQFFEVIENEGFKDNTARYVLETPEYKFIDERAEYDIVKDDKVIYHGDIRVNSAQTVTLDSNHFVPDSKYPNRWELDISITNNRNSSPINAYVNIENPSDFAELMGSTLVSDIKPQETRVLKFFMPEIINKEMRAFKMTVDLSTGERMRYEKSLFFTIAPYAKEGEKPVVDGVASPGEYDGSTWFNVNAGENDVMYMSLYNTNTRWLGNEDLSAKVTMKYDEENLWLFADVTDNLFVNNNVDSMCWDGDSIQVGIADDFVESGGSYNELTTALTPEGPIIYRHLTNDVNNPIGQVEDKEVVIIRDGNHTRYELKIPWAQSLINPSAVKPGYVMKFALLFNEDDGLGRNSFMECSQKLGAIGSYKDVAYFSQMTLAK